MILSENKEFGRGDQVKTMRKIILIGIIGIIAFALFPSCKGGKGKVIIDRLEKPEGASIGQTENPLLSAENRAKRAVLYRLANQEGDLAPYTATQKEIQDSAVPEIAKKINENWWKIDLTQAHLKPLDPAAITPLEESTFPLMAVRVDQTRDEWALFTLGYDPRVISEIIARAHNDWSREELEIFLQTSDDGCLQVWCAMVGGEWKIVANLPCKSNIAPEPPTIAPEPTEQESTEPDTSNGTEPESETGK